MTHTIPYVGQVCVVHSTPAEITAVGPSTLTNSVRSVQYRLLLSRYRHTLFHTSVHDVQPTYWPEAGDTL